jgi:hypothetical protein
MFADTVNVAVLDFSVPSEFDIFNATGPNSSGALFPILTPVPLSDLTLTVNFSDFTSETFFPGSGYFTPTDDLSYVGATLPSTVSITSAVLTGVFDNTSLALNDGSEVTIQPMFTTIMTDSSGILQDGDFAIIAANEIVTPEPSMTLLLIAALVAFALRRRPRGSLFRDDTAGKLGL